MLTIEEQVESGKLVCPKTHQCLVVRGSYLQTADGQFCYPLVNGVPILLDEEKQRKYLAEEDGAMEQTYENMNKPASFRASLLYRIDKLAERGGDYRSSKSREAFETIAEQQGPGDLFLSVGGGPLRVHPKLVNLNIGLFANVDIVGDGYALPYANESVSAVHCEAVLEHLEYPDQAVSQMFRVLKPGGQVFAATPFLQAFHAFPNHFQNFTLIGHQRLFERAGFDIVSSGVCVGPTYTVVDLVARYCAYLPTRVLSQLAPRFVRLLGAIIKRVDLRLNNQNPGAHIMSSTTYVHALKPSELGKASAGKTT
jgi:SAM-dependent methyltransferase